MCVVCVCMLAETGDTEEWEHKKSKNKPSVNTINRPWPDSDHMACRHHSVGHLKPFWPWTLYTLKAQWAYEFHQVCGVTTSGYVVVMGMCTHLLGWFGRSRASSMQPSMASYSSWVERERERDNERSWISAVHFPGWAQDDPLTPHLLTSHTTVLSESSSSTSML